MSSGGTKKRLLRATALIAGQRSQSSSHYGRASPMPLATMASGLAATTASTVTTGAMRLVGVVPASGVSQEEVLRLAGALEDASEHPIARAIAAGARDRGLTLPAVDGFASTQGLGVQGVVDGHAVVAGRPAFVADWALHLDDAGRRMVHDAEALGRTAVVVGWDGAVRGVAAPADAAFQFCQSLA